MLANAAVEPDGIELDFQGDKCGNSYRIKRSCIKSWDSFFYDWHEGWVPIRDYGGWHNRQQAIQSCNNHAVDHRLVKFLPTRPKYKLTHWASGLSGAIAGAANPFGLFGL